MTSKLFLFLLGMGFIYFPFYKSYTCARLEKASNILDVYFKNDRLDNIFRRKNIQHVLTSYDIDLTLSKERGLKELYTYRCYRTFRRRNDIGIFCYDAVINNILGNERDKDHFGS